MFAALDLASGQLFYRFRNRKRWQEFLGFLRQLRSRFPTGRLYVVYDNFSPHHKQQVAVRQHRHRRVERSQHISLDIEVSPQRRASEIDHVRRQDQPVDGKTAHG